MPLAFLAQAWEMVRYICPVPTTSAQDRIAWRPAVLIESGVMLVDVDNFDELRDVSDASLFASTLMRLIRAFLAACSQPIDQLIIRLYGGWYEGNVLTSRASRLAQLAAQADPFPVHHQGAFIAGMVELASGPIYAPGLVLPSTHRIRDTAPRMRQTPNFKDPSCCGDSSCAAKRFARWSEGPRKVCPAEGCNVTYSQAFFGREQKMVDTMITVDLIELAVTRRMGAVVLVSDDTDFVPALLYAQQAGEGGVTVIRTKQIDARLELILDSAGVDSIGLV